MFTGLVEETGKLVSSQREGGSLKLTFSADIVLNETKTGDSININGACQTVVDLSDTTFTVNTVQETIKKSTLGRLKPGDVVNLERALRADARLGGHFVLGHVDTVGNIISVTDLGGSHAYEISFADSFSDYIIPVGSIAVDGISLTVAELKSGSFTIAVIPHTIENTNLKHIGSGSEVNLEFDVLGKYVLKASGKSPGGITEEWLREKGF